MHNLSDVIKLYKNELEIIKNASKKTIENYMHWLGRFLGWWWDKDVKLINKIDIWLYQLYLKEKWLSVKTINYHIIALRTLLKFCADYDIECISHERLKIAKIWANNPSFLEEYEADMILEAPYIYTDNLTKRARDLAILHILYGTGLRVSELCSMTYDDIRIDDPNLDKQKQFSIIGKWSKLRSVFMTNMAMEAMTERLEIRRWLTNNSKYIFVSLSNNINNGNSLTRSSVEDIVQYYVKSAWITKKTTPHTLRHSFATKLLTKWIDIRQVQMLLWHASITTTQIYTHVSDKMLSVAHDVMNS